MKQLESDITLHVEKQEAELALRVNSAAYHGDLYQLKGLVRAGADPNKKDYDGRSPLVWFKIIKFVFCSLTFQANYIKLCFQFIIIFFGGLNSPISSLHKHFDDPEVYTTFKKNDQID